MRVSILLVLLTASIWSSPAAQERTLSGAWLLSADAASGDTPDGGTWSRQAFKGTLSFEQNGSDLKGTWKGPANSWPLTGSAKGDSFEVRSEARPMSATVDGQPTTMMARWTFRGRADGDVMTGTMTLVAVTDDDTTRLQPFTASRQK